MMCSLDTSSDTEQTALTPLRHDRDPKTRQMEIIMHRFWDPDHARRPNTEPAPAGAGTRGH